MSHLRAGFALALLLSLSCEVRQVSRGEPKAPPPEEPASLAVSLPATEPVKPAPPPEPSPEPPNASPYIGSSTAKVTLIVFTDYQCPYCGKVEPTLDALLMKYGEDLRIVWKDYPLPMHKSAKGAAIAARAVARQGNDKYLMFHRTLFANQKVLPADATGYEAYALTTPGVNIEQWRKDIADPEISSYVDSDVAFAKSVGVTGTPAFFINGEPLSGAQVQSKFEEAIERQRTRAEEHLAKGIAPKDLYDELIKPGAPSGKAGLVKVPLLTPLITPTTPPMTPAPPPKPHSHKRIPF